MNDTFLDRETVKCGRCKLVQYVLPDRICRRCKLPVDPPPVEVSQLPPVIRQVAERLVLETITIGQVVRARREQRGWSQRQFAIRLKVPRTYVSKLECNKATPTLRSLQRIAVALGASVGELVGELPNPLLCDPFIAEVAVLTAEFTPAQREQLLTTLHLWSLQPDSKAS